MICPQCSGEFVVGFEICPDCAVALMAEPTLPEPVVQPIRGIDAASELVTVYHATDPFVLAIIESALDAANLPFIVRGESVLALSPYGGLDAGAEILVPAERREEAEALIRDGVGHSV